MKKTPVLLAVLALMALTAPASASAAGPAASAARSCKVPDYPGNGYFTSLAVRGVSCATGRTVARDHYRCRRRDGIRGRCPRVDGYRCTETRRAISTLYDARVTCIKGTRKVVFTYQQNT